MDFVPPLEARTNCVSKRARDAGYYWCGDELYSPENRVVAHYAPTLCPADDGEWATERLWEGKAPSRLIAVNMVAGGDDLEEVKGRTELWLIDHPEPPTE